MAMKLLALSFLCCFFSHYITRVLSETQTGDGEIRASLPPRGWNSYDSFCWVVSEEEFLQNAELVAQRLHAHGYEAIYPSNDEAFQTFPLAAFIEIPASVSLVNFADSYNKALYAVVDYLWYRRHVKGAYVDSLGFDVIDEWGRMVPDPVRWPSSKGGNGFTGVAKKVHSMGLKFGIHIMRGISTQAVNANTPILDITTGSAYVEAGRQWHARDVGMKERSCAWMRNGFMSVNTKLGAGRAFLRSLHQQYADWGIDFVKHDCVFGDDLDIDEISFVSEVLRKSMTPILYSLSPGTSATPAMAKDVSGLVNMYRVTGDDWDTWGDVASHFNVSRDFSAANMIGAKGLLGKSWPDLDMLPLGWLTDPGVNHGPYRTSNLNLDEQITQMTLWSMAKSPLMFGGDMRKLDETTFNLITNPTILEINAFSSDNMEFPYITAAEDPQIRTRVVTGQSRSLTDAGTSGKRALSLTSCKDEDAKGWSTKALGGGLEQVCWKEKSRSKHQAPFCLYKRKALLTSDEETMYNHQHQGKLHLSATDTMEFCLSASSNRKLTSKELKRGSYSRCRLHTNQMWELNDNGTLVNSYSGLCATVNPVKAKAGPGGIRSWIATGRRGEIYVALFNLNPGKTVISTNIADLAKALPSRHLNGDSCSGQEVWTGKDYVAIKSISVAVEAHGCALFVLNCS